MNIYLGIDGVLLVSEGHAANHADVFLQAVIKKYPDSTYLLTTHSRRGEEEVRKVLAARLKPETVALLAKVKLSVWNDLKTDAIDIDHDFLWFDSDLWPDELNVLEKYEVIERFTMIDLNKDPDILQKLTQIVEKASL